MSGNKLIDQCDYLPTPEEIKRGCEAALKARIDWKTREERGESHQKKVSCIRVYCELDFEPM
jgi:hypothetical protein